MARERSWQCLVLTAEVAKNPDGTIALPSMKLCWDKLLPVGFRMPFTMESNSSPGRIDTLMQSYRPSANERKNKPEPADEAAVWKAARAGLKKIKAFYQFYNLFYVLLMYLSSPFACNCWPPFAFFSDS